jgi:uncharacterized protein
VAPAGEIVMRVHRVRAEVVVAACDAELLGRELPVGTQGRTVKVTAFFYGERPVSPGEFLWALKQATTANLLGRRVTELAVEAGYVAPDGLGELGGVPHAEIFAVYEA